MSTKYTSYEEIIEKQEELLRNLKAHLSKLQALLSIVKSEACYEDFVYRFYHQSFKVYQLQDLTRQIAENLRSVAPEGTTFCHYFEELLQAGADSVQFEMEHNADWTRHTRPFVEAYFHAQYFLEMAVKYGQSLDQAPEVLPSGWAALLSLYEIR